MPVSIPIETETAHRPPVREHNLSDRKITSGNQSLQQYQSAGNTSRQQDDSAGNPVKHQDTFRPRHSNGNTAWEDQHPFGNTVRQHHSTGNADRQQQHSSGNAVRQQDLFSAGSYLKQDGNNVMGHHSTGNFARGQNLNTNTNGQLFPPYHNLPGRPGTSRDINGQTPMGLASFGQVPNERHAIDQDQAAGGQHKVGYLSQNRGLFTSMSNSSKPFAPDTHFKRQQPTYPPPQPPVKKISVESDVSLSYYSFPLRFGWGGNACINVIKLLCVLYHVSLLICL